jgi:trimeric autotransporter adhesin
MTTEQRDFKVKRGIVVSGNISAGDGSFTFDATSNNLSIGGEVAVTQPLLDIVSDNVQLVAANTYNTYLTLSSNDYATYVTLAGMIDTVQNNVTSAGGDVDANVYNTYVTLNGFINTVSSNVSALSGELTTISDNVNTLTGDVSSLSGGIDSVSSNVTTLSGDVDIISSNVNSLTSAVDTISSNVNTLTTDVSTLSTAVDTVSSNVNTLSSDISTISSNLNSLESSVSTLTGEVNTISSNVNAFGVSLATVSGNVNVVENRLGSLTYFTGFGTDGETVVATANADSITFVGGDGISISGNAAAKTITVAVDGGSNINAVQDNVTALTANVEVVSSNLNALIDGTTPFSGTVTFEQNIIVDGDLIVGGNTTSISSVDTVLTDRVITLSNGAVSGSFDSGALIVRGSDANVFFGYDESADEYVAAFTTDPGADAVGNFTFSAYANARFNNISVEGLVDGVDISALSSNVSSLQSEVSSVAGNTITNAGRLDSLTYFSTISVDLDNIVASGNASTLSLVAGTGVTLSVDAPNASVTIASAIGADVDTLQNNVNAVSSNVESVSSNLVSLISEVGTVSSNVNSLTTDLGTVSSNLNALTSEVGTISSNVNTLTTSVDTISSNVNALGTSIALVNSNVIALAANVDIVSSNVDAVIDGTTPFTGEVTFQQPIISPLVKVNTQLHSSANVATGIGTSETVLFSFPGNVYRGAELLLLTQDITNSEYQIDKMLIVHDGTSVFFTEYGSVFTGAAELLTFNVSIDVSDVISIASIGGSANKKISVASHKLIQ